MLIQFDQDYRQTSLFHFMEIWLSEDTEFCLDDFKIIHFDRDAARTWKSIGAGSMLLSTTAGQQTSQ